MKRAIMSELAIVRTLVPSIAGVGLFIFVVLTAVRASNGDSDMSAAGAFAISAMSPIMAMTSLAGLDNQNGWERYRATLPISRKDIVSARYLCITIFSVIMTCAAVLLSIVAIPILNSVGIPSTGETVFETAIASAISMLFSLMAVFLVLPLFFRFEHMKAQRLSVGLYALYMCLIQPHQQPAHVDDCRGESRSFRSWLPVRRNCRAGNGRPWRCQLRHQHQGLLGTQPIGKRGIIGHAP